LKRSEIISLYLHYEKANLVYKGFCGFLDDKGEFLVIFMNIYGVS